MISEIKCFQEMIACICQFEIGDFVRHFEGKTQKSSECYFRLKMAVDLKRVKLEFKSLVSGHLNEDFFT